MLTVKNHYYFVKVALCFLLCTGYVANGQTVAPKPATILKEMVSRYESMSSYQDSGVVRRLPDGADLMADIDRRGYQGASLRDDTLVSFKTHFIRPRMFRFEWKSHFLSMSREAVVWSDEKRVYSWMPTLYPKDGSFTLYDQGDLRFYIDGAKASSAGAAFFVPTLLMKNASYFPFADMLSIAEKLALIKEEEVDGETCYVIVGKLSGAPWVFWIGKKSHLLRRTRTIYTAGGSFHESMEKGIGKTFVAEEIHRDIQINERIPKAIFRYKPRLQANDADLTR